MMSTEHTDISETLSSTDAAKYLGLNIQKFRRLRRLGGVIGIRMGDADMYRYTKAALDNADLGIIKEVGRPRKA